MPVVAIPFRSPPAFELPEHVLEGIRGLSQDAAAEGAIALLDQLDAGDLFMVAFTESNDRLVAGPIIASDDEGHAAVLEGLAQLAEPGASPDFLRQSMALGQPLLLMGDLAVGDQPLLPPAIVRHLLNGADQAAVGFLYVFPLVDAQGQKHGALAVHRSLAAGPLNHDQPAIAQALVTELAANAATPLGSM